MTMQSSRSDYWCVLGYYGDVVTSITGPYADRMAAEDARSATERADKSSLPSSLIRYEVQPMTPAEAQADQSSERTTMGVNMDGSAWVRHGDTLYRVYPNVAKPEAVERCVNASFLHHCATGDDLDCVCVARTRNSDCQRIGKSPTSQETSRDSAQSESQHRNKETR